MRFPFFGSKKDSGPIRLQLPEMITVGYAVYFRSQRPTPPDAEQLVPVVHTWLDRHAQDPLRSIIKDFLGRKLLGIQVGARDMLPEPPADILNAWRPGEPEERRFHEATHMLVVHTEDRPSPPRFGHWAALATARALAEAAGGVILDPDFPRLLPLVHLTHDIPADGRLCVTDSIMVPQSVDRRGLMWMTTKGMSKFGLPEFEIKDAPPHLAESLGLVINGTAQHVARELWRRCEPGGPPPKELPLGPEIRVTLEDIVAAYSESQFDSPPEGARGWSEVRLEFISGRGRGDDFLRLVAPAGVKEKHGVWLSSVLSDLLGLGESTLRNVKTDSEAMEAAHLQAVSELPGIKQRFQAGLQPGAMLIVKHGFPTGGDNHEYMWLSVNTWTGDRIRAQLMNNPQVRMDLRAGQHVEIRESEVFDWALRHNNGHMEGGYTNRVVMREGAEG